ncbi:MAG: PAS domain-containing protein, partial [Alphaproteobacteria bacterium]|nr:PAS domain-containing protein [Alphaproteobacteria bacterium]
MMFQTGPGLRGQAIVYQCWQARLYGRAFIGRDDLDLSRMMCELAHVSVLAREGGGFRFRLAGTALRHAFGREARGLLVEDIDACLGRVAWSDGVRRAISQTLPVIGNTRLEDGSAHFWMRLPMSASGDEPDLVLCHDRILPLEALADPDRAARAA